MGDFQNGPVFLGFSAFGQPVFLPADAIPPLGPVLPPGVLAAPVNEAGLRSMGINVPDVVAAARDVAAARGGDAAAAGRAVDWAEVLLTVLALVLKGLSMWESYRAPGK